MGFAFMILMIPIAKYHARWAALESMVSGIACMHMKHLSLIFAIDMALHELTVTALCQIDQMKGPSFLLLFLSHTFPHFNLSLWVRVLCHFVIIDLGVDVLTGENFLQRRMRS